MPVRYYPTGFREATPDSDSSLTKAAQFNVGKFEKASFTAFLHYTLGLVDAVPKRDRSATMEEIQQDLEACLLSISAALDSEESKWCTETIEQGLGIYCKGETEANRTEALVRATNAALILLQPLSIGNSRAAVKPDSDDFLLVTTHSQLTDATSDRGVLYKRMPDISCARRKDIIEAYSKTQDLHNVDVAQMLEHLASPSEPDVVLEWKHHCSCWETIRSSDPLTSMRPAGDDYRATPLKEYGYTANYKAPPPSLYRHRWCSSEKDASNHDSDTELEQAPPDEPTHPINTKWCAEDAENMFYESLGRDHTMNVVINDDFIRVWYFDHESPIQTSAFNFIEDFPHFLLFLFALQRFSPADWGYIDRLSGLNAKASEPLNLSDDPQNHGATRSVTSFRRLDEDYQGYHRLFLRGRATHVIHGNVTTGGKDAPAVLKFSWRQKARFPEGTFLREATKRLQERDLFNACEYLPTLFGDMDFPEFSTDTIRKHLMIPIVDEETRLPYFIVIPRYEPITSRTTDWEAFFHDFVALVYCHFMLWLVGIQHRDISVANLMWDPISGKPKLCDFDLSHFAEREDPGFRNLGTVAFRAVDLLRDPEIQGKIKRLYRHDLESLVAVLVWIMLSCDNGEVKKIRELKEWNDANPLLCRVAREGTYNILPAMEFPPYIPRELWWKMLLASTNVIDMVNNNKMLADRLRITNNENRTAATRLKFKLSPEQEKQLDCLESLDVIELFFLLFEGDSEYMKTMMKEINTQLLGRDKKGGDV